MKGDKKMYESESVVTRIKQQLRKPKLYLALIFILGVLSSLCE